MKFLDIISRGINNGVNLLITTSRSIRSSPNNRTSPATTSSTDNDIEMNAYASNNMIDIHEALAFYPNNIQDDHRPGFLSNYFPSVVGLPLYVDMPIIQRPRFVREMRESTSALLVLLLLLILAITWLASSFGASTPDLHSRNWDQFRNKTSNWLVPQQTNDHAISPAAPAYIPGFYFTFPDESMQENLRKDSNHDVDNDRAATSRQPCNPHVHSSMHVTTKSRRQADNGDGPFHHAYPVHAGRVHKSDQALRIKSQLEHCAENMLRKLNGQGLEITTNFEFALHDCKSAIDFALQTIYPDRAHAEDPKQKRSITIYGVVPGETSTSASSFSLLHPTTLSNTATGSNYFPRLFKRTTCTERFCDWVSPATLNRCYHRDEKEFRSSGTIVYTNDSVDDFKDHAPLECNLCLPEINEEEINTHCKVVKRMEESLFKKLAIALGSFAAFLVCVILVKFLWKKYRGPTHGRIASSRQRRNRRILVMPAARNSSALARRGRVDKRTISYPMPIARPVDTVEEIEGGLELYENPRTPPPPPLAPQT